MKTRILLSEFDAACDLIRSINESSLENLDVIDENGKRVEIPKDVIDTWNFIGLCNRDFLMHCPIVDEKFTMADFK